jgi:hypothetical protein
LSWLALLSHRKFCEGYDNNMIEESMQPSSPQENPTPQVPPPPNSIPRTQKSNKNAWIIIGLGTAVICLCSVVCIAVFGLSLFKINAEREPVATVLDAYMQHMSNKDADAAYALFSPRAQRQIPISKFEELLEGNNYILFDGYQSLSVTNINISAAANTNPDLPQGTVAKVTGVITFEGNIQGSFNGVLEKVGNQWMMDGMHISVPPGKFK